MTSPPLRSFGRIKGRPLKPRQERLFEALFPRIALTPQPEQRIDLNGLLPHAQRFALEIGFGGGEHLVAQALASPTTGFLGAEPFLNGVGVCLRHIEENSVSNVRLYNGDARDIVGALDAGALESVFILFPDPWPKKKHWKRRLIQPAFVAELARVLRKDGDVFFATDWRHYAASALSVFLACPALEWTAERPGDWRAPWPGHVKTRYETKRLGDTEPIWLRFRRR